MDGAITPDVSQLEIETAPRTTEHSAEALKQRAQAKLTEAPGWSLFVERLRARIVQLKTLEGVDITGLSPEQVGTKFLIGREAAVVLEAEIARIEALAAAIARNPPEE